MLAPEFLAVIVITCLAVISPGPDFVVTSRNTLIAGRTTGLATAFGIGLGLSVHVAAAVIGIGLLLVQSATAFALAKVAGGLYLIWLGWRTFRHASNTLPEGGAVAMSPIQGLLWGFVTNATNPKTAIFVVSLFLTVISVDTSVALQLGYGLFIAAAHMVWFGAVALLLSTDAIRQKMLRLKRRLEQAFGGLLILFGGSLMASSAR
ncbi:MAG: LysE family transporter [Pseudomonadota bacterium]